MYKYPYEVVEVCPHCDAENVYEPGTEFPGEYIAICKRCGKQIFLCSECMEHEQSCDWRKQNGYSICKRGVVDETNN